MHDARPIIIIGTQRSGTTWLSKIFESHPDIAFWDEPRNVWTWSNAKTPDDRLTAEHARPEVVEHIRAAFAARAREHHKPRFAEKTPSNCLRVPFIRAVFPDARILLVVRDGRSVIRSTGELMQSGVPTARIWKRAKETPLREWPAYARQAAGLIKSKLTGSKIKYWGPRPPGWNEWVEHDHPDVVLAKQWAHSLSTARNDLNIDGNFHEFRYDDLARDPRSTLTKVFRFADLNVDEAVITQAQESARPESIDKWRSELDDETLDRIQPHMRPLIEELGYAW